MTWTHSDGREQTPTDARIIANGRTIEARVGEPFATQVSNAALSVGFTGKFNVRVARPNQPFVTVTPDNAPARIEAGMRIEVTPHTVGG